MTQAPMPQAPTSRAPEPLGFWHPASLIATWFGVGLLPVAPGTWGSIAALPLAYLIVTLSGTAALLIATVVLFGVGWWAAQVYAEARGDKDPSAVVVDEVVGQWLVLLAAPPAVGHYLIALILFRVFDILKPPPARQIDRDLGGGLGIMLDDVAAGAYGFVVLYLLGLVLR